MESTIRPTAARDCTAFDDPIHSKQFDTPAAASSGR
jgi:hypothetical protein